MILYSTPSSYYSMIARYALNEAHIPFEQKHMDIHFAKDQLADWYIKINSNMTVPALVDDSNKWTDSRSILALATKRAHLNWMDAHEEIAPHIHAIVNAHYQFSIEQLTFGKAMVTFKPLRILFPLMLKKIIRKLSQERLHSEHQIDIDAKIRLNQQRIKYFSQGDLNRKLQEKRDEILTFVKQLPSPGEFLFGEKISSADIVVAIFFARLKMIGEYALIETHFKNLNQWFLHIQSRPAFIKSDIWLRFHPLRILLRN